MNKTPESKKPTAAKWAAIVNDTLIPMPQKDIRAAVLREQAGIPKDQVIVRDHNSENDPVVAEKERVDLGAGNIFYSVPECDAQARQPCTAPAKLAYVIDDRWEVVTRPDQTGRTVRDLFDLDDDVDLLRDNESPDDQIINEADRAAFGDGCVFRTRKHAHTLFIIVNKRKYGERDDVKENMTGREIAALASDQPQNTRVEKISEEKPIEIGLDEKIVIHCGDEFRVIRLNVNAGFQPERIQREIALLRDGGARVTLIEGPVPALIYHGMRVRPGSPIGTTDVLVKIPPGYPAGFLDNAFLPANSPLLTCTPGSAQQTETFNGQAWTQKSVHPHAPNAIPWDKDRHGLHTYYGEVQNWLNATQ
jgi:Prokaryotic E2 family E